MMCEAALLALTLNIYMEAKGESRAGMQAVADTVITRVDRRDYPECVTKVVLQSKQFSWIKKNKVESVFDLMALQRAIIHSKSFNKKEMEAYQRAEQIASMALSSGYKPRNRFTHFHASRIQPYWSYGKRGYRIGKQTFYYRV